MPSERRQWPAYDVLKRQAAGQMSDLASCPVCGCPAAVHMVDMAGNRGLLCPPEGTDPDEMRAIVELAPKPPLVVAVGDAEAFARLKEIAARDRVQDRPEDRLRAAMDLARMVAAPGQLPPPPRYYPVDEPKEPPPFSGQPGSIIRFTPAQIAATRSLKPGETWNEARRAELAAAGVDVNRIEPRERPQPAPTPFNGARRRRYQEDPSGNDK